MGTALSPGIALGMASSSGCLGWKQFREMYLGNYQWVEGPRREPLLEEGTLLLRGLGGQY